MSPQLYHSWCLLLVQHSLIGSISQESTRPSCCHLLLILGGGAVHCMSKGLSFVLIQQTLKQHRKGVGGIGMVLGCERRGG